MKSPFLPLAVACAIVLSSLGSAMADKYSDFYTAYQKAEKDRDYETVTRMTLPADLDTFKQKAVEAYKRAKVELAEKGETRSLTVSTFPDLAVLEKMRPEDVYLAFRKRLAPPDDVQHPEFKYVGYRKMGDTGLIELSFPAEDGGPEKKAFIYVREVSGAVFLRIPDSSFRDL